MSAHVIPETKVLDACRTLFGSDVTLSREFLFYLQPSGAKKAFRRLAKETHPDLFAAEHPDIQKRQNDAFRGLIDAYGLLTEFFKQRKDGLWLPDGFSRGQRRRARRTAAAGDRYYNGTVPFRALETGLYLYYRKSIPYRALIDALVWQRAQRPVIGSIAKRWNWLADRDLQTILSFRGKPFRFGEKAVHLGILSPFRVNVLLYYQRSQQERLGKYFVRRGYLTDEQMDQLIKDLQQHNLSVGAR